jgi:hypothetical protein
VKGVHSLNHRDPQTSRWPGHNQPATCRNRVYCAACAFVAAMSASLRNDITVTFLVR